MIKVAPVGWCRSIAGRICGGLKMGKLKIEYLADQPGKIPEIAAWQFGEWGHLASGDSIVQRATSLEGHLTKEKLPITFLALLGDVAVGSASFVEHDLPGREDLFPWLASVFVLPQHRRNGIGASLVHRVIEEAVHLEVNPIFLFTWDQERLYRNLGWQVLERTHHKGKEIVIMEIYPRIA